ncbi:MAG: hypothetical protein CL910_21035 [Deltaproteobacteria bacterium]|jgi:hypothetical protein|nr:hypothetical protein [Deltaproteobacteria bacterium]
MNAWNRFRPLALALVLAFSATAASGIVLKGRGELHGFGSGLAVLQMRGVLTVKGGGVLIVSEDARVETHGVGRETLLGDGRILYEGFGRAVVASPRPTRIEIAGAGIRLHAKGAGRALLKGCGVVHTDDFDGRWENEIELDFESDQ